MAQSKPLVVVWRWYYHFPTLLLWPLVGLPLVLLKRNRTPQAWLILLPLVLVAVVWRMPLRLVFAPADVEQVFGIVIASLSAGWAVVWLLGDWIRDFAGPVRFALVWGILMAAGALCYVGHFGIAAADELGGLAVMDGVCGLSLAAAMGLSAACCGRAYRPRAFMAWLALWNVLAVAAPVAFLVPVTAVFEGSGPSFPEFVAIVAGSSVLGVIVYVVNLPFMILAFKSPFYRERFRSLWRLGGEFADDLGGLGQSPFALPLSTEPTTKPVDAGDVAGPWRFYVDELARTVALDFKRDGSFSETIITNRGDVTECPGGTWRLDGPRIHVTGYVTARQGTSRECCWWAIDTPAGLAVFGGDEPDSFFRMTPGAVEAAGRVAP